ncbi:MAG: acetate kinase [Clostridia bacterium]|nr:acetate kinase [Clostridia bacterium]
MKILVINCGSSTIKFQLIDVENNDEVIAKGRCDMVGYKESNIIYNNVRDGFKMNEDRPMPTHKEGMEVLLNTLMDKEHGVIESIDEIYAIGHRVVHGGEKFNKSVLVTEEVVNEIDALSELAPLHNPGAVMGIRAMMEVAPEKKNVVVFDTAFHQTIPVYNYLYPIEYKYYTEKKIRRYGFHGTSYQYILGRLEELLGKKKEDINAIVCHLGGGASICAIKNGKSYDTSMGFTPLEGLMMETRCGDIDASIVTKIMKDDNLSVEEMETILNKKSGRLGLCGIGDQRQMMQAEAAGDEQAKLARKVQTHRNKKYIGSYIAELNRVDAIVFTGGNGENNALEREDVVCDMECLGIELDKEINNMSSGKEARISKDSSKIGIYVIPTNEELEIARQTVDIVSKC